MSLAARKPGGRSPRAWNGLKTSPPFRIFSMHYDPGVWCLLAAAVLLASFVQSSMGFGFALVAMGVLPFVLGIRTALLTVSLVAVIPISIAAWECRRDVPWSLVRWCLVGAAVMLPVGLGVFAYVSADLLMRGTGLVILLLSVDGLLRPNKQGLPPVRLRMWSLITGGASGFLTGSVSVGGPPVVIFAARQGWTPTVFKAFVLTFLLIQGVAKIFVLQAVGMLDVSIWRLSLLAGPLAIVGGKLGTHAADHIDARVFRRLTLIMLVLIGGLMLLRGAPK